MYADICAIILYLYVTTELLQNWGKANWTLIRSKFHPSSSIRSIYRHTGLAYGRQAFLCPLTRTALPQLTHKNTVRQEDHHIHVAGLATAFPKLTVAHAQMPLAVPMEALYASPATTINPQYPCDLPMDTIADENLFSIFSAASRIFQFCKSSVNYLGLAE